MKRVRDKDTSAHPYICRAVAKLRCSFFKRHHASAVIFIITLVYVTAGGASDRADAHPLKEIAHSSCTGDDARIICTKLV